MPTPSGLPRKGDRVRFKETGSTFEVIKREGSDALYSLILKPIGFSLPKNIHPAYGYPGCFRLLEAGYWIGRTYELVY